ncbi:hypothetical protein EYF80_011908 [Liparis tanakae]|uniref:Uncharacterized protein n=1 Tax=Liparis tanakae TaxID=230148 RepID=A0A4Z2IJB4_9TELE|nr:hypothetical protein EYF80_011908 [Liparis tanakae]
MLSSLANSSGRALAQKPLWATRSGQAYLGRLSGFILDGSLAVKPRHPDSGIYNATRSLEANDKPHLNDVYIEVSE